MELSKRAIRILESEVLKNTVGWGEAIQIDNYRREIIKINEDNNWDGHGQPYRPTITFISEDRKLLNAWIAMPKKIFNKLDYAVGNILRCQNKEQ